MNLRAATDLVKSITGRDPHTFDVAEIPGFPAFWYVTFLDESGGITIGGRSLVIDKTTEAVFMMSQSQPPHLNLTEVNARLEQRV